MPAPALEKKIADALTKPIASDALQTLIAEVEAAVATATATAEQVAKEALDVTASPDAKLAFERVMEADFTGKRLRVCIPRLHARLNEVLDAEAVQRWLNEYGPLQLQRDALAERFREDYARLANEMASLLASVAAMDEAVHNLNAAAPPSRGVSYHLDHVDAASIGEKVQLPALQPGARAIWPPPRRVDPSYFAPIVSNIGSPGGDWWKQAQQRQQALLERAEREAATR